MAGAEGRLLAGDSDAEQVLAAEELDARWEEDGTPVELDAVLGWEEDAQLVEAVR